MTFGERLTYFRNRSGLNQYQLHKRSGVSASYILNLEAGKHSRPGAATVAKLAGALGITSEELMGVEDPQDGGAEGPAVLEPSVPDSLRDVQVNLLKIGELDPEEYEILVRHIEERRRKLERARGSG
jgi:transcriptional regulator with XRE-family HTH domain